MRMSFMSFLVRMRTSFCVALAQCCFGPDMCRSSAHEGQITIFERFHCPLTKIILLN